MLQANTTLNTNRRDFLKSASAAIVVTPLPPSTDPILAAIERHRAAGFAVQAAIVAIDSEIRLMTEGGQDTNDAEYEAANIEFEEATHVLLTTFPTTQGGLAALLERLGEDPYEPSPPTFGETVIAVATRDLAINDYFSKLASHLRSRHIGWS